MTVDHRVGLRAARWVWRAAFAVVLVAVVGPLGAAAEEEDGADDWKRADHQRVVKVFDFDEPDNLGTIPKYWELFGGESFPRYAGGGFDPEVGRTAPPSFYLDMNGRNVAFRYRGIETRIRPNSDYLVVGWIKPNDLRTSRATITAYYLDYEGMPLRETQRQGRLVGGDDSSEGWHRVEVFMPAGPFEASALGLTLWVEQASIWDPTPRPEHHIERSDVHAGAWFDDILVYRLPRVTLSTPAQGDIFVAPQVAELRTTVLDHDGAGLSAALEVCDATGEVVDRCAIPVQVEAHQVVLPDLDPGYYQARLRITSGGHTLVNRRLAFAVLTDIRAGLRYTSHAFGVVLEGAERSGAESEVALVAAAGLGAVKVPLWTGSEATPGLVEDTPTLDVLLNGLLRLRVDVTGVLGGLPPELAHGADETQRSLIDILNDPVESWRGYLGAAVAPYASVLASWQVGTDGDPAVANDPRLADVLAAVRSEMLTLMTSPYLTAPGWVDVDPRGQTLPVERFTLTVPGGIHPDYIGAHLQPFRELGIMRLEAYIEALPHTYDRIARLSHWAAQILETRHAGVDAVYVPQLWRWRPTVSGPTVEPTEEFIVYRTIAALLGEARPDGMLFADEGVRALVFSQGERSVLAVWDRRAPPEGRTWEVQLGAAKRVVDLWGRSTPLERTADGLHRLTLTPTPVFVDDIERWVTAFQRQLRLLPESVTFSLATHEHAVHIANPSPGVLIGRLTLEVPETWRARPRNLEFNISAGGRSTFPVELRYGNNESAGAKVLYADVQLRGSEEYHLRVPLCFDLGIEDVDVWSFATLRGNRVIVRHGVRNRSDEALSFRAYATAPGRDRQYKVIIGLEPGESITREYRFEDAEDLAGQTIRVSLREVNGPRMHNLQLTVP